MLRARLPRLRRLTHVNLQSKCDDEMLIQLAKNCANLEELQGGRQSMGSGHFSSSSLARNINYKSRKAGAGK